jgi:uncharacterized membrane protein YkoI
MRKFLVMSLFALSLTASPTWAMFDSNQELLNSARISLDEAVRAALLVVPGRAVEAEIEKEDGRTVYEVKILDLQNKDYKVYIDAQSGMLFKIDD